MRHLRKASVKNSISKFEIITQIYIVDIFEHVKVKLINKLLN